MNQWDWEFTFEILPVLLDGFKITILATLVGMTFALIGGLLFAMLRRSRLKVVSYPAAFVIEFIRSTPLLVQLYFLYFVLPDVFSEFGIETQLSPLTTGIIGLALHYSAYTSEVYRSGIDSIPKGQWEACTALNLTKSQTFKRVILPQAIPPILPALGNYLVAMFKDTPLLATITVLEVFNYAKQIGSEEFRYLEPITLVGVLFLVVSLISAFGIKLLERKLNLEHT